MLRGRCTAPAPPDRPAPAPAHPPAPLRECPEHGTVRPRRTTALPPQALELSSRPSPVTTRPRAAGSGGQSPRCPAPSRCRMRSVPPSSPARLPRRSRPAAPPPGSVASRRYPDPRPANRRPDAAAPRPAAATHGRVRALLWARTPHARAHRAAQRVVDVAHHRHRHAVQRPDGGGTRPDVRDVRAACRPPVRSGAPARSRNTDAQRGGGAAAAVVGGSCRPRARHQTLCAVGQRRAPSAVPRRRWWCVSGSRPTLRQRQPRRRGASPPPPCRPAAGRRSSPPSVAAGAAARRGGHARPAARRPETQSTVPSPPSATGRASTCQPGTARLRAMQQIAGEDRVPLKKGIGDHETAFHGGGTPFA